MGKEIKIKFDENVVQDDIKDVDLVIALGKRSFN